MQKKEKQTLANSSKQKNSFQCLNYIQLWQGRLSQVGSGPAILQPNKPRAFYWLRRARPADEQSPGGIHITGGHRTPSHFLRQVIHHDSMIHHDSPLASLSFYHCTIGFPCEAHNSPARIAATKHGCHSILELVQWRAGRFPGIKHLEERWPSFMQQIDLRQFEFASEVCLCLPICKINVRWIS